jgi:hypothetical protein
MEPAVRVALMGKAHLHHGRFDDSRREASNRARRPRLRAVPTAEFQFGNPRAAVNRTQKIHKKKTRQKGKSKNQSN